MVESHEQKADCNFPLEHMYDVTHTYPVSNLYSLNHVLLKLKLDNLCYELKMVQGMSQAGNNNGKPGKRTILRQIG